MDFPIVGETRASTTRMQSDPARSGDQLAFSAMPPPVRGNIDAAFITDGFAGRERLYIALWAYLACRTPSQWYPAGDF